MSSVSKIIISSVSTKYYYLKYAVSISTVLSEFGIKKGLVENKFGT